MSKKVLITGGAGFIGSHVTDKLIENGYEVIIADNYSNINSGYKNDNATYIKADILEDSFEEIFKKYEPDFCIHLAAQASVSIATKDPVYDAQQNIIGSIKVMQLCKKYQTKKLVVASSAAVYGNPEYLPVDEKHLTKVLSEYGLSKLTMENYLKLSGIDYIIFRFANVYGERQTAHGEAGVIATFANLMAENKHVYIDGNGEQTRDFVYVKDIAQACYLAIKEDIKNQTINVSTNTSISINQLFENMANICNYTLKPIYREARAGDIKDSVLDNSKYSKAFGIKNFTTTNDGLNFLTKGTVAK